MKKVTFLVVSLAVLFFGFNSKAQAQVDVSINPISILWGDITVGADFALSENLSVEGQIGYSSNTTAGAKYTGIPITAFGKYYFNPTRGTDRFYGSVFLRFVSRSYEADDSFSDYEYTRTRLGAGVGIGYKIVSSGNFVFDIGLGVGRAFVDNTSIKVGNESVVVDWTDVMFACKLAIGYRF